jgi:chromosome segregation ATPase
LTYVIIGASSSLVTASSELENLRSSYQELETKLMEAEQKREQAEKQLAEKNSELTREKGEFLLKRNADSETIKRQQKELNGLRRYMETAERHWDFLNEYILGMKPEL